MHTKITSALKISSLALVLSFGLSYVYAWTAPTVNPPAGNVSAPINTSITAQTKLGDISAWNLVSNSLTTNILKIPGSIAGQVLTAVDTAGTVAWAAAPTGGGGGTGGGGNYTHGSKSFNVADSGTWTVPAGVTSIMVEVQAGGGGGGAAWGGGCGSTGGGSSVGPLTGAPFISATGGVGGYSSDLTTNCPGVRDIFPSGDIPASNPPKIGLSGGNGIGTGGAINSVGNDAVPDGALGGQGYRGSGFVTGTWYPGGTSAYSGGTVIGGTGGFGGYSQGVFSVVPRQKLLVTVGDGGAQGSSPVDVYNYKGAAGKVIIYW